MLLPHRALALGARYTGVKAVLALIAVVFLLAALVPIPGRVSAEAEVRALVSRTIPPPFEGFLDEVRVKPGDVVRAGDVLATMDLKETLLGLEQAQVRLRKLRTQQDDARNRGQQGEAAVLAAAAEETQGQRTVRGRAQSRRAAKPRSASDQAVGARRASARRVDWRAEEGSSSPAHGGIPAA